MFCLPRAQKQYAGEKEGCMIKYHVAVIGLGQLGGRLAKELCRFFNAIENRCVERVALFDGAVVDVCDMDGQEFLPEDIGWHKAAVLTGVYNDVFSRVGVKGYGHVKGRCMLEAGLGLTNIYSSNEHVALIYDMSNGGRGVSRIVREFFGTFPNCIVMTPAKGGLHVAVKLATAKLGTPVASVRKAHYTATDAMRICRICLAKTAMLITDGNLSNAPIYLSKDGFGVAGDMQAVDCKPQTVSFAKKGEPLLCVVVGCGGTGGNFIKEFVHTQMCMHENLSLLMIDGDRVEEKNLERQPFSEDDIMQNKACCLKHDLIEEHPILQGRLFDYPCYLDTVKDLSVAVEQTGYSGKYLLVGAVDNHRARQVLEGFYHYAKDCVYIDAANEWSNGEVVVSVKRAGREQSPLRSFYYPDVLTDNSPSASELSCGVVNESAPQHFCTNLASAQGVLGAMEPIVKTGRARGGIFYFDAFREYARFQEVWYKDMENMC